MLTAHVSGDTLTFLACGTRTRDIDTSGNMVLYNYFFEVYSLPSSSHRLLFERGDGRGEFKDYETLHTRRSQIVT